MNNKVLKTVGGAIVVALAGLSIYTANQTYEEVDDVTIVGNNVDGAAAANSVNFSISEDGKLLQYDGQPDETALATLKSQTEVKVKDTEFGEFVEAINGVAADSSKEYWAFYVNGKLASEGAGTYKAKEGDKLEWKLENL